MTDIKGMEPVAWIDALAQKIREVDGNHSLGAGALAEALAPFIVDQVKELDAGQARAADAEAICDSYADENQRLYDRATTAEAALAEARKVATHLDCWLAAALEYKEWAWDVDQRAYAEKARSDFRAWLQANKGDA